VQLHTFKGISSIQVKCSHSKGDVNLTSSNQNANKDIHVWGGVNIFRLIRGEKLCFWKNPQENIIVITKNISVTHVPKRHVKECPWRIVLRKKNWVYLSSHLIINVHPHSGTKSSSSKRMNSN
jgi:hypothetical protein